MSVIVRYILRELGVTFLFGFVAFTCLLLAIGLVKEAIDNHVPLVYIWELVPYVFVEMFPISLPVTLLLAVTIFFAKMSGNNEVVALKALGIPPRDFLLPVFAIALFASVFGVWINDQAIKWGRQGISAIIYRGAEDILIEQLRQTKQFETDNKQVTILVKGVNEQHRLLEPTIMLKRESITVEARTAQISIDFSTDILTLTLEDIRVTGDGGRFEIVGGDRVIPIPLSEVMSTGEGKSASNMDLQRIKEERKKVTALIEQQRRIVAAHRVFAATMGSVDDWAMPQIAEAKQEMRRLHSQYNRLSVEPPRRWAAGFCCFFFVWLGAPLAIWMRKSDFFASFFACFVPILILYYPLLAFGLDQAKKGGLPPMSVWLANISMGLIGLWFLRQIHRY